LPRAERKHAEKAFERGFTISGIVYLTFASLGYYAFYGACAADAITLNLLDSHRVVGSAAMIANLTATFMIIPINCFVTMRILDDSLVAVGGPSLSERPAAVTDTSLGMESGRVLQRLGAIATLARLALVASLATIAVSIPDFHVVVALIGAFSTMLISFILPTIIYVIVHRDTLRLAHLLLDAALLALGFVGMVLGVQNALA